MVRDIEAKHEKASTELDIAKEYELKYSLKKPIKQGRQWTGYKM